MGGHHQGVYARLRRAMGRLYGANVEAPSVGAAHRVAHHDFARLFTNRPNSVTHLPPKEKGHASLATIFRTGNRHATAQSARLAAFVREQATFPDDPRDRVKSTKITGGMGQTLRQTGRRGRWPE